MTPQPQTELSVQAHAHTANLNVVGLLGVAAPTLTLRSDDGKLALNIPVELLGGMRPEPGEKLLVHFGFTRIAIRAVEPPSTLIIPKGVN